MNNRLAYRLSAVLMVWGLSSLTLQSANAAAACALIENDIARLQCYDERELPRTNTTTDAPVPVVNSEPVVLVPTQLETAPAIVAEPEPVAELPTVPTVVAEPEPVAELPITPVVVAEPEPVAELPIAPAVVAEPEPVAELPITPVTAATEVAQIISGDAAASEPAPLPAEIRSTITNIITALNGRKVFFLENGERWQETTAYGLRFRVGSDVTLKKGLLNAYNMTSGRNTIRVARY